jgi:hypothetical protein
LRQVIEVVVSQGDLQGLDRLPHGFPYAIRIAG